MVMDVANIVILNLFQDLHQEIALLPHEMLKRVQHDEKWEG